MEKHDSKYESIEKTLSAIGKATFVQFYYEFKDTTISTEELAQKILLNNPRAKSSNQNFRIPRARHIFEKGKELEALQIIMESAKVDLASKKLAKKIYDKETSHKEIFEDDEEDFKDGVNREILYSSESNSYEYDNTPKPSKKKSVITSNTYVRSKKVAKNALSKAGFVCEVCSSHPLFKRKNSNINYTEPHHLVPLCASNRFSEIDLDREQNVVSLCSNCHNHLHYGADIDDILKPLYNIRKILLEKIGINIMYEELKKYYE